MKNQTSILMSLAVLCAGLSFIAASIYAEDNNGLLAPKAGEEDQIPIIHVTDLFHPPADPDDHFSVACLFALSELHLRGIILDMGIAQSDRSGLRSGKVPVEQLNHITSRNVPYVAGLGYPLRSRTDKALDQEERFQGGVNLILSTLRESKEKVILSTGASCRDIAAAFNREPDLMRKKVRAVYLNVGFPNGERLSECNTKYDPLAYLRILESGLPIYHFPCCSSIDFKFSLGTVLSPCTRRVQNYFLYALDRSTEDPIAFIDEKTFPLSVWSKVRWMPSEREVGQGHMCDLASFLHAAGREIYERSPGDYVALSPKVAQTAGLSARKVEAFRLVPVRVKLRPDSEPLHYPNPEMENPKPGQLNAAFWDWGMRDPAGMGVAATVCIRVIGLEADKSIKDVIVSCWAGSWESDKQTKYLWPPWPLGTARRGQQLDCYLCWAVSGRHAVKVIYQDDSSASAQFEMPEVGAVSFDVERNSPQPNCLQASTTDEHYGEVMTSCFKNLLSGIGR